MANLCEQFYPLFTSTPLKLIAWVTPDAIATALREKLNSVGKKLKIPVKIFEKEGGVLSPSYKASWNLTKKLRSGDHSMALHMTNEQDNENDGATNPILPRHQGNSIESVIDEDDNVSDAYHKDNDDNDEKSDEDEDACQRFLRDVIYSKDFEKKCGTSDRQMRLKQLYSLKGYLPKKEKKDLPEIGISTRDSKRLQTPSKAKLQTPYKLKEFLTLQDPDIKNASFILEQKLPSNRATSKNHVKVGGVLTRSQSRRRRGRSEGHAAAKPSNEDDMKVDEGEAADKNTEDEEEESGEIDAEKTREDRDNHRKSEKKGKEGHTELKRKRRAHAPPSINIKEKKKMKGDPGDIVDTDEAQRRLEKSLSDEILDQG